MILFHSTEPPYQPMATLLLLAALLGVAAPAPAAPATTAPTVTIQAIPAADKIEAGDGLTLLIAVTNQSAVALAALDLTVETDAFAKLQPTRLASQLPPFASILKQVRISEAAAGPGPRTLLVVVSYDWSDEGQARHSSIVTPVKVEIRHHFEDEAKGLPGGTAALLMILLPVIPAFLSFQLAEQFRRGQSFEIPAFKAEHIPFAFFIAMTVAVVRLVPGAPLAREISEGKALLEIIAVSAGLGVIVPMSRWVASQVRRRRWSLREDDDAPTYLKKVLFGPGRRARVLWVSGTAGGQAVAGLQLSQPDESPALGACMQITPNANLADDERLAIWNTLNAEILTGDGGVREGGRLIELIKARKVDVLFQKKIVAGGQTVDAWVRTEGMKAFERTAPAPVAEPLVTAVR